MSDNGSEVTQRLDAVIAKLEDRERSLNRKRAAAKPTARQPMEWSAALVLIVFALVALGAWVSFLFIV